MDTMDLTDLNDTQPGDSKDQADQAILVETMDVKVSAAKRHRLFPEFEKTEIQQLKDELGDEYVEFGDPSGDPEADLDFFWSWVSERDHDDDDDTNKNDCEDDENEDEQNKTETTTIFTPSHTYPSPPSDKHPDINSILESAAKVDGWETK